MVMRCAKRLTQVIHKLLLWVLATAYIGLAQPVLTFAQDVETATAGRGSAKPFTLNCRDDEVLIGVKGSAGSFVDNIQGICSQVSGNGSGNPVWRGSQQTTGSAGGNSIFGAGLTPYELLCPANQAVVGISGRAGDYVDQLRIHCSPLLGGARVDSSSIALVSGQAGGNTGTGFGPLTCPDRKPAKGLKGNSGSFVDKIGLVCNRPFIFDPGLSALTITPGTIISGGSASGVVVLEGRAANSTTVTLSSGNLQIATVQPQTVAINRGEDRASFSVSTSSRLGCTTIRAAANSTNTSAPLVAQAAANRDFSLSLPEWVVNYNSQVTGTIRLNLPEPLNLPDLPLSAKEIGIPVTLSSSDPAVTFPTNPVVIKVAAGGRSGEASFSFNGIPGGCVVITATIDLPTGAAADKRLQQLPNWLPKKVTTSRVIQFIPPSG